MIVFDTQFLIHFQFLHIPNFLIHSQFFDTLIQFIQSEFDRSWEAIDDEGNRNEPTTDSDEAKGVDGESRRKKRIQEIFFQNIRDGLIADRRDSIKSVTEKPVLVVPVHGVNVDDKGINHVQKIYDADERADREEYRTDYKDFLTDYDEIRLVPKTDPQKSNPDENNSFPNSVQDVREKELNQVDSLSNQDTFLW